MKILRNTQLKTTFLGVKVVWTFDSTQPREHWVTGLLTFGAIGRVVAWNWNTMNVHDKRFNPLGEPFIGQTIVLADYGFRDQDSIPENMKICKKELGMSECVLKRLCC